MKKDYKLIIIGSSSAYTSEIFNEIIKWRNKLPIRDIVLVDINNDGKKKSKIIESFTQHILRINNIECEWSLIFDCREVIKNADFITNELNMRCMVTKAADKNLGINLGVIE